MMNISCKFEVSTYNTLCSRWPTKLLAESRITPVPAILFFKMMAKIFPGKILWLWIYPAHLRSLPIIPWPPLADTFITATKVLFWADYIDLFVCLLLFDLNNNEQILTKFSENVQNCTRNRWFNFGGDLYHHLDSGNFLMNFHHSTLNKY